VRVFTVNPRIDLSWVETYASYRDKMAAMMDAAHPQRDALVQQGVGDVASRIRPSDPNAPADVLVAFPEDIGLLAGLIGSRGAVAREVTAQDGSTLAFVALGLGYASQIRHYSQLYPGLPGLRHLLLALTDTNYRGFYETFRDLARAHGVYLTASVNVAPARRVDAATDPDLVALLRDPDEAESRDYAYEAVSPQVVNTMFLFAPDGEVLTVDETGATVRSPADTGGVIRGSVDKAYLTEIEQNPLGIASGAVSRLDVLDTPVGRIGALTSKDAWMIDVNDRYDAKRAQLIVQPEAFDSWGFVVEPWSPDNFKAGGFAQVQRNPSFLYNLTPCMVGNLYEITFDGQSALIGKRHKGLQPPLTPQTAWIGQNPDTGFLGIAPWIRDDPAVETPGLALLERRAILAAAGENLLPGSGVACEGPTDFGACENGYRESVLSRDIEIPDAQTAPAREPDQLVPTDFDPARFVDPSGGGEQREPAVAARGGRVFIVWQDSRNGLDNVYLGVSANGGRAFSVERVSDNSPGSVAELRPDIALSRDGESLFVVWQEFCLGGQDDCGRIKLARFDGGGNKLGDDLRVDSGGDGSGKWNAAVAVSRRGDPLVVWVDERDRSVDGLPFEHIYFAAGREGGKSFGPSVRVDRGRPTAFAASLDNKWAPAIAAGRRWIQIAWTDFRNYQWDIYSARSRNGLRFRRNLRVDDAVEFERIHDHPSLAFDDRHQVHVVWADHRRREPDTDVRYTRGLLGGRRFKPSRQVDSSELGFDPNADTPSNQWHPEIAVSGDDVFVVWQDNRLGDNDVFFARSRDGGDSFEHDERVDDSGDDPSEQTRPDIGVDNLDPEGRTLHVVWEDARFGPAKVAVSRRLVPRAEQAP